MAKAASLRAEAERIRKMAQGFTDPHVLAEMQDLIDELEGRARTLDNGDAEN